MGGSLRPSKLKSRGRGLPPQRYCFLAAHGLYEGSEMPLCEGQLIRAHLIKQQTLLKVKVIRQDPKLVWHDALWVWACGGINGSSGHHGMFDSSRRLRLSREKLPAPTEAIATELDLLWWLDRTYGPVPQ